ncbi:MAG: helix-turn-helix transcriptional regulator [Sphingomonas sp.]|nr:helix-turn-helix transcriptional regulator [Sphingomonas sp.]
MADTFTPLAHWRKARGWTLDEAAAAFGLKSKGYLSEIERGERCSVAAALEIERVTDGVICASTLNPDVALVDKARAA